jgi:hypothetical protein
MSETTNEGGNDMRARITKLVVALSALAALAVGGSTLASAGSKASPQPAKQPAAQTTAKQPAAGATDGDTVQQGDQSTPDTAATEQPGSESTTEQPESATAEAGSEQAADDGPGGHADEPGNPNADHQFEGVE